jgi:uncharacterized membrane protein
VSTLYGGRKLSEEQVKLNLELSSEEQRDVQVPFIEGEDDVEEMPLWPYSLGFGACWIIAAITFFVAHDDPESCGGGDCAGVFGSALGSVGPLSLSSLGPFVYALPLLILAWIALNRKREARSGDERYALRIAAGFRDLLVITYAFIGFELYLIYAQFVLGRFCVFCSALAFMMLLTGALVIYGDRYYGWWPHLLPRFPRWAVVLMSALGLHFVISPRGAYDPSETSDLLEQMKKNALKTAAIAELGQKPYEIVGTGVRVKRKLMRIEGDDFADRLAKTDSFKILSDNDLEGRLASQIAEVDVAIVEERYETKVHYDYKKIMENRIQGDKDAPLKMVLYINYACSACADFEMEAVDHVQDMVESGQLVIETKWFHMEEMKFGDVPITLAACAALQGKEVFQKVHRRLFETQKKWAKKDGNVISHINDIVNVPEMVRALTEYDELPEMILGEVKYASSLGVDSTPTIHIYRNGEDQPLRRFSRVRGPALKRVLEKLNRDV